MSRNSSVHAATFPGCTTRDVADHVKALLRRKPDEIVIHVGTNSLKSHESPRVCAEEIVDLAWSVDNSTSDTTVTISSLVTRTDEDGMSEKIRSVNNTLKQFCRQTHWNFIDHSNITPNHLNRSRLHLNKTGTSILARNFITHIKGG